MQADLFYLARLLVEEYPQAPAPRPPPPPPLFPPLTPHPRPLPFPPRLFDGDESNCFL